MTKVIYSIALCLVTLVIWNLLYHAQFLEYDENYGNLLGAFFLSVAATIILLFLWFKWRHIINNCKWQTIAFLIVSSPLTVAIVSINYQTIFGAMLKN